MIRDHDFEDYRGRRVLVMGLGSFGGGLGAVRFLKSRGAHVTVTDTRPAEKLAESLKELDQAPPDRLVLGRHDESDFRQTELVVVNPAVKRDNPFLNVAAEAGVSISSEMNLFWQWNCAPVVAVTGSNGKSTTTALIHSILERFIDSQPNRRVWLGGNIGTSLLPLVDQIKTEDLVVLELSSFQLADLDRLQVSPHVGVVTNFAPNHLDWHPELQHYRESKQTLLRWQSATDFAVLNADDPDVSQWTVNGSRLNFGLNHQQTEGAFLEHGHAMIRIGNREERWPIRDWLRLPGPHNIANALAAIAACVAIGSDRDSVQAGIENYQPLPHRLQFIAEVAGRRFYNDSLATTPESTSVALISFENPIVLLAGGYDKHVDLSQMASDVAARVKAVSLMGQTGPTLQRLIAGHSDNRCLVSSLHGSFDDAFAWVIKHSEPGDVVLLSPGCASYDWFRNFADRGFQFIERVDRYRQSIETG